MLQNVSPECNVGVPAVRADYFLKLGEFVGGVTDPDAMSPLQLFSVFERNRRRRRLPHLFLHIEKVISPVPAVAP